MIEQDGYEWGSPREVGDEIGVRDTCLRDWVRDGLLIETDDNATTEVRRYGRNGRYIAVKLVAAARVAKETEGRGRHRTPLDTPGVSPLLDIPC